MAAPNIVGVTTISGKTSVQLVTTSATAIVTNAAASGKVVKVNLLTVSNVNGASPADITVDLFRDSVAYRVVSTISIPEDASLDMLSKSIYLEEGDSLRLTASADLYLESVCSYEEIS
tara:strand:+ start:2118 stop:2471 length:354 start_codon:yes stop_codon:yes gene_type:complete